MKQEKHKVYVPWLENIGSWHTENKIQFTLSVTDTLNGKQVRKYEKIMYSDIFGKL